MKLPIIIAVLLATTASAQDDAEGVYWHCYGAADADNGPYYLSSVFEHTPNMEGLYFSQREALAEKLMAEFRAKFEAHVLETQGVSLTVSKCTGRTATKTYSKAGWYKSRESIAIGPRGLPTRKVVEIEWDPQQGS